MNRSVWIYLKTGSCAQPDVPTLDQPLLELVWFPDHIWLTLSAEGGIQDAQVSPQLCSAQHGGADGKWGKTQPPCGDQGAPSDHFTLQGALDQAAPGQRLWESNSPRLGQPPHGQRRSLSGGCNPFIAPWHKLWSNNMEDLFILPTRTMVFKFCSMSSRILFQGLRGRGGEREAQGLEFWVCCPVSTRAGVTVTSFIFRYVGVCIGRGEDFNC